MPLRYKRRVRRLAQRVGVDLLRYPQSDSMWRVVRILETAHIDSVVDVGANDGGYARSLREHGFGGWIRSFEPLAEPFRRLQQSAAGDGRWTVEQLALGGADGELDMHIAGNDGASSSALPMLERHVVAAPSSAYVGSERVRVRRLDDAIGRLDETQRTHLKVDVQGFEREVLDGAPELLASRSLVGLQLELSLVELYGGAMLWQEALDRVLALGFELVGVLPGFADFETGHTLQFDGVFLRSEAA